MILAAAAGGWWLLRDRAGEPPAVTEPDPASVPVEEEPGGEGQSRYPVPGDGDPNQAIGTDDGPRAADAPAPAPLPPLDQSDPSVVAALRSLFGTRAVDDWLIERRIVERLVATINSLDGPAIPLRFWPVRHIEGVPTVVRDGEVLRWSEDNTRRYRVPVAILVTVDPAALAQAYFRRYPLFQQAYDALGYGDAYFNDRLVEVIDHLLGAPEVEPGFRVKQPKVLYQFADPELESESWGRKVLMRMGPRNAQRVKDWLRRLRRELVAGAAGAP